ncbi:MAG: type I restriction endonuclease subunit S [Betaproteobacteria bacterium]|nr:type I restriction endonuclease subunit S [Betaproteobacteria bacterium]
MEWLETIPYHWEVKRLKQFCSVFPSNVDKKSVEGETPVKLCNYTDVYYNDFIAEDLEFMEATATEEQIKKFTLQAGDTIITKDSETADDIAIAACVTKDLPGVICGYHLSVVRPKGVACGAFVKRLFDSIYAKSLFAVRANGLTRVGLSQYAIDNVELPLPPVKEQKAIATFLDRETAKIDALIAEQQRLIELLQEKRQAVISHAVTKGLNPNAPMKDSGVEWLGEVPEHWEVKPLKHLANIQTGMAKGKDVDGMETREAPFLRVANVQDGYLDLEDVHVITVPASAVERYLLRKGDVLMNEGGDFDKLGRGCLWNGEIDECIHQNHVFAVRPHSVTGDWLNTYTTSKPANSYFISRSKQSTNLASISSSNLMGLVVPVPPVSEATEILRRLGLKLKEFDGLRKASAKATSLLQERRSALISAAVTGQIDVRGLVQKEEP